MSDLRIIGTYSQDVFGPLVVITGAIHGNEPAGVLAIQQVLDILNHLPAHVTFKGKMVGLIGHYAAFKKQIRFFKHDLNRLWEKTRVEQALTECDAGCTEDEEELAALFQIIRRKVRAYHPEKLIVLDLHTTSAEDGLFSIPTDEKASLELAKALHVPVVLKLFDNVQGTLLRFSVEGGFAAGTGYPKETLGVAFEAGKHTDPRAAERCAGAILSALQWGGCLPSDLLLPDSVEHLRADGACLPKVVSLHSVHHIQPEDEFKMRPGYRNFQPVRRGEHLADDKNGPVLSSVDGYILMPLYQKLGHEGFFLVR